MPNYVTMWNPFMLTDRGLEMRQKAIAESVVITFNYAKIGEGVPKDPVNINLMTDLVLPVHEAPVIRSIVEGVTHNVGVRIDNMEYEQPVIMREIGLFASVNGEQPVLYGYTYATQGYDSIPAGRVAHYIWTINIDTVLSRTADITFVYDGSTVYATYEDIDRIIDSFNDLRDEVLGSGSAAYEQLVEHRQTTVRAEDGIHGIRLNGRALETWNDETMQWEVVPGIQDGIDALELARNNAAAITIVDERVDALEDGIGQGLTANPFTIKFDTLNGINLERGAWNPTLMQIEC